MKTKRRRTREEIRELVREFRQSGLSDIEFAKKVGVQPQHIRGWNLREETQEGETGLVRVKLRDVAPGTAKGAGESPVEVVLRNGLVLRVPQHLERKYLIELVGILEERC